MPLPQLTARHILLFKQVPKQVRKVSFITFLKQKKTLMQLPYDLTSTVSAFPCISFISLGCQPCKVGTEPHLNF